MNLIVIQSSNFFNKNTSIFWKKNLLNYVEPSKPITQILKSINQTNKIVSIIDLTGYNHYEINYYSTFQNFSVNYIQCKDAKHNYINLSHFEYAITNKKSYNKTYNSCNWCFEKKVIEKCDSLRQNVVTKSKLISVYNSSDFKKNSIHFYKIIFLDS